MMVDTPNGRRKVMAEILGLDTLVAQMILAIGLALVAGNSWAALRHFRGRPPPGQRGVFRPRRAGFLILAGILMVIWSAVSLLS